MKNINNTATFWITGISGAGKSTLANYLKKELDKKNLPNIILDGDEIRNAFDKKKSFTKKERLNIAYQYSKLAKFINDQEINVIFATISLFHEIHIYNRENLNNYIEIFLDRKIEKIKLEDIKSIYSKEKNVVGIDITAELPKAPTYHICNPKKSDYPSISKKIVKEFLTQQVL